MVRNGAADEDAMADRVTVHDPRGYPPKVVGKRLAPRLSTLDGMTIYLVDCLFDNSDAFADQLRQWFGEHLPSVNVRTIKPKETWADDQEMRATIAAGGDGAILGIGL
jgi:hypothetical protein